MAGTKPQAKPEKASDENATPEPAADTAEPQATATAAAEPAADADAAPPAPPSDEPEQDPEPSVDRAVLILRDETVVDVDYKPGDTPKLAAATADYLIARGAADDNPKAVAAARKARGTGAKQEQAIE